MRRRKKGRGRKEGREGGRECEGGGEEKTRRRRMGESVREKENKDRINGIHYNITPYITQDCSDELFFGGRHPKEH